MFTDSVGNSFERPAPLQRVGDDAKKVHAGPIFDIYQWEQKMYDNSFATFERVREKDGVVGICVTPEKKILLLREEQPGRTEYVGFPGGGLEEGEDPVFAVQRELTEETGYEAKEVIFWRARQLNPTSDRAFFTFIMRGCTPTGQKKSEPGEKIAVSEISFDQMMKIIGTDDTFLHKDIGFYILKEYFGDPEMKEFKKLLFE